MAENKQGQIVETAVEARGATKDKPTRNVLFISTAAVIVIFAVIWLFYFK